MTRIFAISNQKGGVAKTTSCLSLGACLAEQGQRTLLVDLDPQAHLSLSSGASDEQVGETIVDVLSQDDPGIPPGLPLAAQTQGLSLLPGDIRLASLERSLYDRPGYEYLLAQALAPLREDFDTILLDCPPSMGALTLMALTAADHALIPVQCEFFATQGLLQLLDIITAVQDRTNPVLDYRLFVTLFDGRNLISRRIHEQLQNRFSDRLLETVIRMDTRVRESAVAREPVTLYAPKTRASLQYRSLANEISAIPFSNG